MRQKTILTIVLLSLTVSAFAFKADLSFDRETKKRTLITRLTFENTKYLVKVVQNQNGLFTIQMPSFFVIKNNNFSLGEIKFSNHKIVQTNTPSLNPSYSGLLYKYKKVNFAVFSPVFSPESPFGTYLSFEHDDFLVSLKYENQNKYNATLEVNSYQKEWSEITPQGNSLELYVSNKTEHSSIAIDSSYNQFLGLKTSAECSLKTDHLLYEQTLDDGCTQKLQFSYGKDAFSSIEYLSHRGLKPLYGGTAQEALFLLSYKFSYKNLSFQASSKNEYKKSTGCICSTEYKLGYHLKRTSISALFTFMRTKGTQYSFLFKDFSMSSENLSLRVKNGKIQLVLKTSITAGDIKIKLSVNQDRELTIKTDFSI